MQAAAWEPRHWFVGESDKLSSPPALLFDPGLGPADEWAHQAELTRWNFKMVS